MAEDVRRHRFGPLERRGLVGSLRPAQVVVLATSLTTGVFLLRLLPSGVGALAAIGLVLATLGFCFWPIAGRRARTYAAVLAAKVSSFGLLDRSEQEARQAGWGGVLASLAREGSPVSRIQWLERTVPADGDEIGRYLGEAWDRGTVSIESLAMQSYLGLVGSAPAVTKDHELFVCLQIDAKRAWRQI